MTTGHENFVRMDSHQAKTPDLREKLPAHLKCASGSPLTVYSIVIPLLELALPQIENGWTCGRHAIDDDRYRVRANTRK